RRKKTKCAGERPACRFCQRLGQECVYLAREQHNPRAEKNPGITKLYVECMSPPLIIVRMRRERPTKIVPRTLTERRGSTVTVSPVPPGPEPDDPGGGEPSPDVVDHFVEVYKRDIAFKPLPLFTSASELSAVRLSAWPRHLRFSFFALTMRFSPHPFFRGHDNERAGFFATSAYSDIMPLVLEGCAKLEVVQSLCLLVLHDLKVHKTSRAWSSIGMAARLEISRGWNRRDVAHRPSPRDGAHGESSSCFWCVYILEKSFSAQCSILDRCIAQPRYPDSASLPPITTAPASAPTAVEPTQDNGDRFSGINSSFLQVISIWGDVNSYVHRIRRGKLERPWLPTSRYTELTQAMYEFEDQTALKHLLKNTGFMERTPEDIAQNPEYWRPWILMQITHHATWAVLHHPFIHIVGLRDDKTRRQPPRLFMQGVIDQAQYHSQWVGRLVQACKALDFDIHCPLLGTLVAATATVAWVFRFAPDGAASSKAIECFKSCEGFVKTAAATWPHIEEKAKLLASLRDLSGQTRSDDGNSVITFRPSKLWELLDSSIVPNPVSHSGSGPSSTRESPLPDATLSVTTHILHPVDEARSQPISPATTGNSEGVQGQMVPGGDELCFDEFFSQYLPTEMSWAPEANNGVAWQNQGVEREM
ncbi:hypothetical protein F5X68DRAFT_137095, partial [Plectosphaerella plurivora]